MKKPKLPGKPLRLSSSFDTSVKIIEDKALPLGRTEVETRGANDKYPG